MKQEIAVDKIAKAGRGYIILFLLTFLTALPGIFTMPALDRDEARFAQASKQMLETGDYILIREQEELRNKKPAGIHWMQAGTTALFSSAEAKEIWSYRIPSLLGAAFATCFVFWAGIPLIGRRAAFLGAALFATGFMLIFETNIAKTDSVLTALTTLGVAAFIHLRDEADKPKRLALIFWAAMGVGFLVKGPVSLMVAALTIAFSSLWYRHGISKWPALLLIAITLFFVGNYLNLGPLNGLLSTILTGLSSLLFLACGVRVFLDEYKESWFRHLIWWPGPILCVLLVLPWFVWIQLATDGAFFKGAVGKDLGDKVGGASEGHGGLPGFHTLVLALAIFPATLYLIPALMSGFKRLRLADGASETGVMMLVSWALPTFLLFEFLPTKLPHYVLPVYPALALLMGYTVLEMADGMKMPVSKSVSAGLFVLVLVIFGGISPIGIAQLQAPALGDFNTASADRVAESWSHMPAPIWAYGLAVLAGLGALFSFFSQRHVAAIALTVLTGIALTMHVRVVTLPQQVWVQSTTTARLALADICGLSGQKGCDKSPDLIQAYGYAEPSFPFTTGTDVLIRPESSLTLPPVDEAALAVWVFNLEDQNVSEESIRAVEAQAEAQERCATRSKSFYALNYSNGDPAHFVALRVDAGACG